MKPGDKVQWTAVGRGRIVSITHREGEIVAIEGDVATVKPNGRGKDKAVPVNQLRLIGEKSQLTEFVEAVVEVNRGRL